MEPSDEAGSTFLRADEVDEAGPEPVTVAEPEQTNRILLDTVEQQRLGINVLQHQDSQAPRPPTTRDASSSFEQQPAQLSAESTDPDNPPDSISLLQLRNLVSALPTVEPTPYAFKYEDASSFEEELDELFGYGWDEREAILVSKASFAKQWMKSNGHDDPDEYKTGSWDWGDATLPQQAAFLDQLKVELENDTSGVSALSTLETLTYIALGCWYETGLPNRTSQNPDDTEGTQEQQQATHGANAYTQQLSMIQRNVLLVAEIIGVDVIYRQMQRAHVGDDFDEEVQTSTDRLHPTNWADHRERFKWHSTVLMYLLVDMAGRHEEDVKHQELRSSILDLTPGLLSYLTEMLADLRWDESNALPPKKLLLLYWKSILVTFGGVARVDAIKADLTKQQTGSDTRQDEKLITASPLDYHVFRQEITSKYPAFDPPPPLFPFEPESTSVIPPLQEHSTRGMFSNPSAASAGPVSINGTGSSIIHQPVHIATPAPSPPPSPAGPGGKGIKKQNYQTNQMFPFLYPPLEESSNDLGGKGTSELHDLFANRKWHGSDIPASILEAADIFAKRMRATRAMKQLWNERVRFMKYERGYGMTDVEDAANEAGEKDAEDVNDLTAIDDDSRKRLKAVDDFYRRSLPKLQSMITVLLKVLLQTVTTLVTQPNAPNGLQNGFQSPDGQPPSKAEVNGHANMNGTSNVDSILNDLDTMRSQEIMGKAVSGILLLLCKWLKLSHVLKAEYFTQLLLDSNYVPLMLKLFTHQELERLVNYRCDRPKLNFLRFCQTHSSAGSKRNQSSEDWTDSDDANSYVKRTDSSEDGPPLAAHPPPPEVDELGYPTSEVPASPITAFSWRNFFSSINYLRILQKVTKHKAHRHMNMVQLKYSNILKKTLKVPQPDIRLYTLKIIKGQVPYCPRKWRSSNMRIITAIYLHCKPELRDEWLAGVDVEQESPESLSIEQALRSLTYWHNLRLYPEAMGQDKDKARGLMEEEQDFFLRELAKMDAALGAATAEADIVEGEELIEPRANGFEAPVHIEGW